MHPVSTLELIQNCNNTIHGVETVEVLCTVISFDILLRKSVHTPKLFRVV